MEFSSQIIRGFEFRLLEEVEDKRGGIQMLCLPRFCGYVFLRFSPYTETVNGYAHAKCNAWFIIVVQQIWGSTPVLGT